MDIGMLTFYDVIGDSNSTSGDPAGEGNPAGSPSMSLHPLAHFFGLVVLGILGLTM
jgi:hypothetical protein